MRSGDRVMILDDRNGPGWLNVGDMATADYFLPSYDKIICKLDRPTNGHTSVCLYGSEQDKHWKVVR
jgi:hypothetical protein